MGRLFSITTKLTLTGCLLSARGPAKSLPNILFLTYILLFKINFYCSIVALQCCISFCCTARWISYPYIFTPSFLDSLPFRSPQSFEYSSFCYTFCSHELSILYTVVYISEKTMAPHSGTLAWKIPGMEEPGWLQSMGSLRVGQDWVTSLSLFTFIH